jgi:UDPglucose--hexose-1-phosphate uridylyltransferase
LIPVEQVFPNDFPALLSPQAAVTPEANEPKSRFFHSEETFGYCKVMTYSPRHDLTLSKMSVKEIRDVVKCWTATYVEAGEAIRKGHSLLDDGRLADGCVNIFEVRESW